MTCKICSGETEVFSAGELLGKYNVQYFRCRNCGFVHTEEPYWLSEAYSDAIAATDVGLVQRNLESASICRAVISLWFDPSGKFVDYGGGYGLLVRLMRDAGFDFYRYDQYCPNFFARGFDLDTDRPIQYELLTALEVWEHLADPMDEVRKMLGRSRSILFSTELLPRSNPKPGRWWYYGLDHGQHISFYTLEALRAMSRAFGLNLWTNGKSFHLLTEKRPSTALFSLLTHPRIAFWANIYFRRKTLKDDDFIKVKTRTR